MLKTLTGAHSLELQRQEILLRCEQQRLQILVDLDDLDSRTRWQQLLGHAAVVFAPKAQLLAPLLGMLLSRKLFGSSGKGKGKTTDLLKYVGTAVRVVKSLGALVSRTRRRPPA